MARQRTATCAFADARARVAPGRATKGRPPTTELFFGAGLPGAMPGAGPLPAPAMAGSPPLVVPAPRTPPDRTVPPLRELVDVPAGPYRLGEPGEEREVELAAVRIGRFPVVCAHMARFAAETGHPLSARLRARLADPQLEDHPATEVTFADALAFCAWAGARLPTGDEWEAAARGADARPWPWGETFEPERCACAEAAGGWSAPVRAHPDGASPCGAEQLAGNVWEWVADAPDPDGWRAVRGGSWLDYAWGVRASRVLPADPDRATATTGFRIALDP